MPESLPEEKRFDMMMLALILLINLVEQCDDNKQLLIESKTPLSSDDIFDCMYSQFIQFLNVTMIAQI